MTRIRAEMKITNANLYFIWFGGTEGQRMLGQGRLNTPSIPDSPINYAKMMLVHRMDMLFFSPRTICVFVENQLRGRGGLE